MLFVQSITYNLTNPDDGRCELYTNRIDCTAETSSFGTGDPVCYWERGVKRGSCHFNQPGNNLKIVLFVAIFAAVISTPIALTADWVIMNVLAAQTRKRKSAVSAAALTSLSSTSKRDSSAGYSSVVPGGSEAGTGEVTSGVPYRSCRAGHLAVGNGSGKVTPSNALRNGDDSASAVATRRRRYSVAKMLGLETNANLLKTTLHEDLSSLLRGLCAYRETLTNEAQRREFSGEYLIPVLVCCWGPFPCTSYRCCVYASSNYCLLVG